MFKLLFTVLTIGILIACLAMVCNANQVAVNFSQESVSILGDYEKDVKSWDFAADAQLDLNTLIGNASIERSFGLVGLKPFTNYNRSDIGQSIDGGLLVNFNLDSVDLAFGASYRNSQSVVDNGRKAFDENGNEITVYDNDPTQTYSLPDENNHNLIVKAEFEKWNIETEATGSISITKRDTVPDIIISRSQTSLELTHNLSFSIVVDARIYLDEAEWSVTPMGSIAYRF